MKEIKPKFILTRIYEDGSQDAPEITPLSEAIGDAKMGRRGFFGAGITAAVALTLLDSCASLSQRTVSKPRPTDRECGKRYAHSDDIVWLAISSNSAILASGSKDHTVKCWALSNHALICTFKSTHSYRKAALSPDGTKIAFGTSFSGNELRTLPAGKLIKTFEGQVFGFSPNGEQLIVGHNGYINFHYLNRDATRSVYLVSNSEIKSLAISPNGNYIAVGTGNNSVLLLDSKGNNIKTLVGEYKNTVSLAFSPNEQRLAVSQASSQSSSANRATIIFGIPNGERLYKANGNTNGLMFSSDGELLFWDKPAINALQIGSFSMKDMSPLRGELTMIPSPDGRYIITGGHDGSVKIWLLPDLAFSNCLMDVNCSGQQTKGITYNYTDEWGQTLSFTLPCGSPLPAGATCVCNCVPGKMESVCTCNRVCSCDRVCTCQSVSVGTYCRCNRVCVCLAV